jgi:hypothetical protein
MWVINTRDFCGVGVKDQKGKQWHSHVCGSNDGWSIEIKSCRWANMWLPEGQAPLWNMEVTSDPHEAWVTIYSEQAAAHARITIYTGCQTENMASCAIDKREAPVGKHHKRADGPNATTTGGGDEE